MPVKGRNAKGLARAASEGELADHPLVSMDERGHASMAVSPLPGFFQEANLVAFGVVQVRHATVRPICGRPQERGSSLGQLLVGCGEVVHDENKEALGGLPARPRWTPMDGESHGPRIEVDYVACVEEEWQRDVGKVGACSSVQGSRNQREAQPDSSA